MNTLGNEDDDIFSIEGDTRVYYDNYDENDRARSLMANFPSPGVVKLCKGAKVLCTTKVSADIVPGTIGTVVTLVVMCC